MPEFSDISSKNGGRKIIPLKDIKATFSKTDELVTIIQNRGATTMEPCRPTDILSPPMY